MNYIVLYELFKYLIVIYIIPMLWTLNNNVIDYTKYMILWYNTILQFSVIFPRKFHVIHIFKVIILLIMNIVVRICNINFHFVLRHLVNGMCLHRRLNICNSVLNNTICISQYKQNNFDSTDTDKRPILFSTARNESDYQTVT